MSVMRSSLIGSLLQALKFNVDRKAARARLFEVGRIFLRDDKVATTDSTVKGIHQPMRVAALAWGDSGQSRWEGKVPRTDFFDVKGDVEALLAPRVASFEPVAHPALHPGRAARVLLDGRVIGVVGELHPRWRQQWDFAQPPVLFELDLDAVMAQPAPAALPVAKYQAVERDIALVVAESVTHDALMWAIRDAADSQLLRELTLFDIYRPAAGAGAGGLAAGEKSMAVRLSFNSDAAMLTDEQIESAVRAIVAQLGARLGARLRE
jgi:phenylalanyl-tRNA synthetase beta chain